MAMHAAAFSHVLCPIDFSETSRRALQHAAALASWYHARLSVLHVTAHEGETVPVVGAPGEGIVVLPTPSSDQLAARLRWEVSQVVAAPSSVQMLVAAGLPHRVVLEQIREAGADLLVLGTHGRTGFEPFFLGSTTEKLLQTATCPVLTVPPRAEHEPPLRPRQILCPTDFSASARRARDIALDVAGQTGACVTMLHALEYVDPQGLPEYAEPTMHAHREYLIEHRRQQLHEEASAPGAACDVREVLAIDRAWRQVLEQAREIPADLIVMGAQGNTGVELMLYGSTTQHVVRRATCPVLTVRA